MKQKSNIKGLEFPTREALHKCLDIAAEFKVFSCKVLPQWNTVILDDIIHEAVFSLCKERDLGVREVAIFSIQELSEEEQAEVIKKQAGTLRRLSRKGLFS